MSLIKNIIRPLFKGEVVNDPAQMKKLQIAVTAIGALVAVFVPALAPYLSADFILKVFAAYAAVNAYFTVASSEKIGI